MTDRIPSQQAELGGKNDAVQKELAELQQDGNGQAAGKELPPPPQAPGAPNQGAQQQAERVGVEIIGAGSENSIVRKVFPNGNIKVTSQKDSSYTIYEPGKNGKDGKFVEVRDALGSVTKPKDNGQIEIKELDGEITVYPKGTIGFKGMVTFTDNDGIVHERSLNGHRIEKLPNDNIKESTGMDGSYTIFEPGKNGKDGKIIEASDARGSIARPKENGQIEIQEPDGKITVYPKGIIDTKGKVTFTGNDGSIREHSLNGYRVEKNPDGSIRKIENRDRSTEEQRHDEKGTVKTTTIEGRKVCEETEFAKPTAVRVETVSGQKEFKNVVSVANYYGPKGEHIAQSLKFAPPGLSMSLDTPEGKLSLNASSLDILRPKGNAPNAMYYNSNNNFGLEKKDGSKTTVFADTLSALRDENTGAEVLALSSRDVNGTPLAYIKHDANGDKPIIGQLKDIGLDLFLARSAAYNKDRLTKDDQTYFENLIKQADQPLKMDRKELVQWAETVRKASNDAFENHAEPEVPPIVPIPGETEIFSLPLKSDHDSGARGAERAANLLHYPAAPELSRQLDLIESGIHYKDEAVGIYAEALSRTGDKPKAVDLLTDFVKSNPAIVPSDGMFVRAVMDSGAHKNQTFRDALQKLGKEGIELLKDIDTAVKYPDFA